MRLDKLLANQGFGTRSEVGKAISKGFVTVNGQVIRVKDTKVDPDKDRVLFGQETVNYTPDVYIHFYKPKGCISATDDKRHETVLDYIDHPMSRQLFPVGRLDIDTTGLLIITNNGQLAHNMLSPKKHVQKVYEAVVSGNVSATATGVFKEGVIIDDGYRTHPSILQITDYNESDDTTAVRLTIDEGKFHQVKRMFEAIGHTVLQLHRAEMGPIQLDKTLSPGEYRLMNEKEMNELLPFLG